MTPLAPLRPALCRHNLLPKKTIALMRDIYSRSKELDITSLTLTLNSDGNYWQVLAGVDFTKHGLMRIPVTDIRLPEDLLEDAKALTFELMKDQHLANEIEEVDGDFVISERSGNYALTFFEGCAILYPDNLAAFIRSHGSEISANPDKISSRAQVCTIIMEKAVSQHERLAQLRSIQDALSDWRKLTGISVKTYERNIGFEVIDPTADEIAGCSKTFISKGAS